MKTILTTPLWVRKQSLFFRFLGTYIIVLLIPLALGLWVNSEVVREFQQNVENTQLSVLRQTRDVVERSIDDLEWRVFQIAANPRLNRLITEYRSTGQENIQQIRELVTNLNSFTLYSSNLKSTFYLYLVEPPIILTPYSVYRHSDFVDSRTYLTIEGTTVRDWHQLIFSQYFRRAFFPARRVTLEDFTNKPMIPYVQSFPVGSGQSSQTISGALVFFLGEEEFGSLLNNIPLTQGGWTYIADQTGAIITGKSADSTTPLVSVAPGDPESGEGLQRITFGNKDYFVVRVQSPSGWQYVAVLPTASVLAPVIRLQRLSLITLSLSLLFSMFAATIISYRRAQPLQQLLSSLRDYVGIEGDKGAGIKALDTGVHRLMDRSIVLQNQLEEQESFNRNLLVNRILLGSFQSNNEARSFIEYLGISQAHPSFRVLVFDFTGFESLETVYMIDELNRMKVVLKELLQKQFPGKIYLHDTHGNRIAVLLVGDADLDFGLKELKRSFADLHHPGLLIGIGRKKDQITEVAGSFQEAKQALAAKTGDHGIFIHRESENQGGYYYPIELEVKISNAVRAGDQETLQQTFQVLNRENLENRELGLQDYTDLFQELQSTYRKLNLQHDESPGFDLEVRDNDDPKQKILAMEDILLTSAATINRSKRSHNQQLIDGIVKFIHQSLTESGLGLYTVASRFSITESYLSFFFKEQTGENFSTYIEKQRVERAVELLVNTDGGMMDVAREVGYNNDKTFRRVFKKLKGISPSEYRQQVLLKKII